MSNWITTGQMIDLLKVGEIAELEPNKRIPKKYGPSYKHLIKTEEGDIRWCKSDGSIQSSTPIQIYGNVLTWKWRILPKYVSFSEAMKAIEEGKDVVCYLHDEKITLTSYNGKVGSILYKTHGVSGGGASLKIAYMVAGKWAIKEDTE